MRMTKRVAQWPLCHDILLTLVGTVSARNRLLNHAKLQQEAQEMVLIAFGQRHRRGNVTHETGDVATA